MFPSASTTRPPTLEREQNSNGQVLNTAGVAANTPPTINNHPASLQSTANHCETHMYSGLLSFTPLHGVVRMIISILSGKFRSPKFCVYVQRMGMMTSFANNYLLLDRYLRMYSEIICVGVALNPFILKF